MAAIFLDPSVATMLKARKIQRIATVRDAAICLMSESWPKHGPAAEHAAWVLLEAHEGRASAEEARDAFAAAARESGVLIGD